MDQRVIIRNFVENNPAPKQRTQEWFDMRTKRIGGSEMASIVGTDPHKKPADIVISKVKKVYIKPNIYMMFGTVMERVCVMFVEMMCACSVIEGGCYNGCIPYTSYSPDGFTVIKRAILDDLITRNVIEYISKEELDTITDERGDISVLLEIKSPSTRIPNGIVPLNYLPQPKSGLCHFPFINMAMFVDVKIEYVDEFTDEDNFNMCGFIMIGNMQYNPCAQLEDKLKVIIENENNVIYSDIGEIDITRCARILADKGIREYELLKYKIKHFSFIPIMRDPNYVLALQKRINFIISTIEKYINSAPEDINEFARPENKRRFNQLVYMIKAEHEPSPTANPQLAPL